MSYLNATRIHFAGQFRADVSTVNNDTLHFDEATFVPSDQMPAPDPSQTVDGWWQPQGTGAWRIDKCTVTAAVLDGAESADPVVGLEIRDTGDRVSAKLVDLDPDAQMVSTIFGLEVRIVDPVRKVVLMRGQFQPVGFFDLFMPRPQSPGSTDAFPGSAFYQSVLTDVEWGDIEGSAVLHALQAASPQLLSIKFMVDNYYMDKPERGFGRIVGTIGPQMAGDPLHFTPGRFLAPENPPQFGYVGCWVDQANRKVIADFGNAIQTANGGLYDLGSVHLVILPPGNQPPIDLGELQNYSTAGWYERTAGIQGFPPDRALTEAELSALAGSPLGAALPGPPFSLLAVEAGDGIFLRPDLFVYRLEPSAQQQARAMALKFGQPLADVEVVTTVSVTGSVPGAADALTASAGSTGPDGWVTINLQSTDPGLPRAGGTVGGGPDGQVYSVALATPASTGPTAAGTAFWPFAAIAIQVYSEIAVPAAPDWGTNVLPILQQYSNLYPRPHGPDSYSPFAAEPPLHPVVNLSDPVQVGAYAELIQGALQRPIDHPNHMPVTRDLSAGRRQILLKWLAALPGSSASTGAAEPQPSTKAAVPEAAATRPAQAPLRDFAEERTAFAAPPPRAAAPPERNADRPVPPKAKMPSKGVK